MRVLMLSWTFPPASAGGIGAHVDGLSHGLASAGHDTVVLTTHAPGTGPDVVQAGVRVLRADVDMPWIPADAVLARAASGNHALVAATTRLGDWRPDVVHAHDWNVSWAADTLARLWGVPLVTTLHGTERGRHGGHLPPGDPSDINAVEWWLAFRSSRIITGTKLMVREITGGFELDPTLVRRIPNGIDPAWWRSGCDAPTTHDEPLVVAWGRVQYEKGFQVLTRAMAELRSRHPGIRCVIAGRGSYLPELQSQVDIDGVADVVHLAGFVPDVELRDLIHRATCVVIPSLYEPFGIVALEALAAGSPLVVADTGGLGEVVGGTGAALTFEPGNVVQLAERIDQLITAPELAAEMRRHGAALLDATYSWGAIADRTVEVYRDARSG